MNNLMEKILTIETLERVVRLESFLRKAYVRCTDPDRKVIDIYTNALNELKEATRKVVKRLGVNYGELNKEERVACLRRLFDVFNSLDYLHSQLQFIHGDWTSPETYVFVKALFHGLPDQITDVSIVLSDTYMFEEVDLSTHINYRLSYFNILPPQGEVRPTLFLPKIEHTNPLNWSILVHEMGHVIAPRLEDLFSPAEISAMTTTAEGIKTLSRWLEEVCCDLIALKLLGPAYLISYSTFAIVLGAQGGLEESSSSHPADRFRINIMKGVLEAWGEDWSVGEGIFNEFKTVIDLFDYLFETRCKFERDFLVTTTPEKAQFPVRYQAFKQLLLKRIDDITLPNLKRFHLDPQRIESLETRIEKGVIIGSLCPKGKEDEARRLLEEHSRRWKTREAEDDQTKSIQQFREILDCIEESPTEPSEIVSAGWLYKCKYAYPKMIELLFGRNANKDFDDRVNEIGSMVLELDDKLRKAVEVSHIHRLLMEERIHDPK